MIIKNILILLIISLFFIRCNNSNIKSEGVILYEISYPKIKSNSIFNMFLPSNMETYFDKYNVRSNFNGILKNSIFTNSEDKTYIHTINDFSRKYKLELKECDVDKIIKKVNNNFKIEYTKEEKKILGYNCKKAILINKNNNQKYCIYYTEEINIYDPNWNTPYKEIKGVLLEYETVINKIEMKFIAKNIEFKEIDKSMFSVDKEYKNINITEFDGIMDKYVQNSVN